MPYKLVLIFFVLIIFLYLENNNIVISKYKIRSKTLPSEFNNFKILHISDLHNKVFLYNNRGLINKIKKEKADIIVITGDLVDRRKYNEDKAISLIRKLKDIDPIYYVTGNHEGWSGKFHSLEKKLKHEGVTVLRNILHIYKKNKQNIFILGVDDPAFSTKNYTDRLKDYDIIKKNLEKINKEKGFKILLSHRPELFKLYVEKNIDLVFSGHAHGGQIIIPFLGGIIAPHQGFFPKYYKGTHKKNGTTMVISRGLGNSLAPQRIFNRPEIVTVILKSYK
ncbi:metallophosphoesterase [Clostridium tetanomorphum]|uniref:Metallophosphoesterase n=2 Tax=Clostridium tetanomorphum TaxID=1553 RepID=A0A923EER3_CLOTT|nr:metallophosphoesterase [Clostridium tetanomorphum]